MHALPHGQFSAITRFDYLDANVNKGFFRGGGGMAVRGVVGRGTHKDREPCTVGLNISDFDCEDYKALPLQSVSSKRLH